MKTRRADVTPADSRVWAGAGIKARGAESGTQTQSLDHLNSKEKFTVENIAQMSLYYEAAAVLANPDRAGGSLKSRIYNQKDLKSSPAQIVALVTEASKWSPVLKDVIEQSGQIGRAHV